MLSFLSRASIHPFSFMLITIFGISQAIDRLANFSLCCAYRNVPSASTHLLLRPGLSTLVPLPARSRIPFIFWYLPLRSSCVVCFQSSYGFMLDLYLFPALVYLQLSSDLPLLRVFVRLSHVCSDPFYVPPLVLVCGGFVA
jgi:hypothetical protein